MRQTILGAAAPPIIDVGLRTSPTLLSRGPYTSSPRSRRIGLFSLVLEVGAGMRFETNFDSTTPKDGPVGKSVEKLIRPILYI